MKKTMDLSAAMLSAADKPRSWDVAGLLRDGAARIRELEAALRDKTYEAETASADLAHLDRKVIHGCANFHCNLCDGPRPE